MTQPFRTPSGGRIRRDQPIRFTFDGRPYDGHAGDTLASALLANGVHLVGRSFKYHRPRGILCAGSEEPNALVTIDKGDGRVTPNLRATTVALYQGLTARSQNAWPSIRFDLGAIAGFLAPLLAAGFYYKTFMWPAAFWRRLYEPAIRAAAGLGWAPASPDPDRYLHRYAHCDVLVIGAGPAGLAAAAAAAARGDRVILCDEQAEPGGSLLARPDMRIDGRPVLDWIAAAGMGVTVLPRTTAFGWYPGNMVCLAERVTDHLARPNPNLPRERLWLVRASRVVIATGAIERPSVFPGNDRPGIMLVGAAATYLHRYGVLPGRRIVVATSHDSAWFTAFALAAAGATIAAILDQRDAVDPALREQARAAGIPVHSGARITGTGGRRRVRFVRTDKTPGRIRCDTVLMSDGWTPSVQLFSQSRGILRFDPASGTFLPGQSAARERSAGACNGTFDLAACLAEGHGAGGGDPRTFDVTSEPKFGAPVPPRPGQPHGKAFVDFQNDVTTKDLAIATSEGFRAIEHVKRYTTAGMATDQGKTGNLNTLAAVAALTGRSIPEIGLTTFRPPYTPVTFGTFAGAARGDLFDPIRRTPIDDQDAVFEDVGTWQRARYFPRPGETMRQAVARECRAVRNDLGLFDASTLGKIEVVGPDSAEFLNRMYTGDFARLEPGRCKYGLLLGEDGFIRDDGVIARLAPDRFHVTTTTGGAAGVLHHMEDYLQTEFPSLRVWLTSTTEQWAVIALQGPRAAAALAPLLDDIDLATMPHMSVREGRFAGVPARLCRVSFTGEPGFEINLPATFARSAWDLLRETGATRYGTETMHVLRAEKGFVIVGQETDGTVIPDDLGLNRTIARGKADFVGKRSLARPDMGREDRKQLVGLLTADPAVVLEEGAQLTTTGTVSLGHVTSAYHSATLGRSIALALLSGGRSRIGTTLRVPLPEGVVAVTVTDPVFYDRTGDRMTGALILSDGRPARAQGVTGDITPHQPPCPARPCAEVELAMAPATGKFSVRTREQLAPVLRAVTRDSHTVLWLGPDEYLVTGDEPPRIAADSIVDVSHRTVAFRVHGPRAGWCLNAFCALDLDDLPGNGCTRTLFGKAEIVLWRRGDAEFHIETARSFAPYVWALLEEARREFLPPSAAC
jgi:sarcosine oxidase subunit alpha